VRQKKWQTWIDAEKFRTPLARGGELMRSIDRCREPYEFLVKYKFNKAKHHVLSELRILRDGKDLHRFKCGYRSSFVLLGDHFFHTMLSNGNGPIAYDLSTGEKLWEADSVQYRGFVSGIGLERAQIQPSTGLEIDGEAPGDALIVTRIFNASGCMQVLDRKTGESLAFKKFTLNTGPFETREKPRMP